MELVQKVTDINPDGSVSLLTIVDVGPPARDGGKQHFYIKMTPYGKIIQASSTGMENAASLPEHPVKIGDTWISETLLNMSNVKEPVNYKNTYTLKEFVIMGKYECALILMLSERLNVILNVPENPDSKISQIIDSEGEIYFAYKEGKLIKSVSRTSTYAELDEYNIETQHTVETEIIQ